MPRSGSRNNRGLQMSIHGRTVRRVIIPRSGALLNPFSQAGRGGAGQPGFDAGGFGDILSDLFGQATRGRPGGTPPRSRSERGRDLEAEISIGFEQAIAGAEVPISVPTHERCATCQGEGRKRTVKRYRVNVPAGAREGSRIRLAGKGEPGRNGGPSGDLFVLTHVQPSPVFARKGDHVEVEVPLTIPEALRGANIEVPTLDGRKTLRVPPGTRPGTTQRLRGEGPKRFGKAGRGDIHYRFVLDLPDSLTAEQEAAVDDLAKVFDGDPRAGLFS